MGLIFVVATDQVARLESLRASLVGAEDLLIVGDRRHGERRRASADAVSAPSARDRRSTDRRVTNIDRSLRTLGWALVEQTR